MRWHAMHVGAWAAAGLIGAQTWLLAAAATWDEDLVVLLWAVGTAAVALVVALPRHVTVRRDIGHGPYLRSLVATAVLAVVVIGACAGLAILIGRIALVAGAALAVPLSGPMAMWWMAGRGPGRYAVVSLLAATDAFALLAAMWFLLPWSGALLWVTVAAAGGTAFAINGLVVSHWAQPFQPRPRLGRP